MYGGYSRQQFAYFVIYEARDKKGRPAFRFSQVPVWLASRIASEEGALEKYAREQATSEQLEFVRIQRSKILKRQLIEIDGERFVITGKREMRNATEIAFSLDEGELLEAVIDGSCDSDSEIQELLKGLACRVCTVGGTIANNLDVVSLPSKASAITSEEKKALLLGLINVVNGKKNTIDLSYVGGGKGAGRLTPSFSKLLNDPNTDFYIVDQSVTGMFERRTHVGL